MGIGNRKIEGDIPQNEEGKNPIEDNRQQMNESPSDSSPNNNMRDVNNQFKEINKARQERYKGYEPYNIEEIDSIVKEAEKKASKIKRLDEKLSHFSLALNKVDLIIKNSKEVFDIREKNGEIDFPDEYWERLDQANNSREKLRIKIQELQITKPNEDNVLPESNTEPNIVVNDVKMSTPEIIQPRENMNAKQAADYLGVSVSTVNHRALSGEIKSAKLGGRRIFRRADLDEYIENHITKKPKRQAAINEDFKKLHFILEGQFLEQITNVFVEKEYIDNDSAILMKDRFSVEPKQEEGKILWKKDLVSLLTFVYLADRLEYFDRGNPENFRSHPKTSKKEIKEMNYDDSHKEVEHPNLVNSNFTFIDKFNLSRVNLGRKWQDINLCVVKLRKDIANRINSEESRKPKVKDAKGIDSITIEESIEGKFTRKEAIIEYFKLTEKGKFFRIDDKMIDIRMLEIFYNIWQKSSTKTS